MKMRLMEMEMEILRYFQPTRAIADPSILADVTKNVDHMMLMSIKPKHTGDTTFGPAGKPWPCPSHPSLPVPD
jgi:hypothetical protein